MPPSCSSRLTSRWRGSTCELRFAAASFWAAASASWDLIVNRSACIVLGLRPPHPDAHAVRPARHQRLLGRLVRHEIEPEAATHPGDLGLELLPHPLGAALHPLHPALHLLELALELEHPLDAGQVHAELGGERLDPAQALDILLRVEPRSLWRAVRLDQAARLVDSKRLRMHAGELRGHGDHVDRPLSLGRCHQLGLAPKSRSRGLPFITCSSSSMASLCSFESVRGTSMPSR